MEKVMGIGGVFFRARDPKGLARWYQENLGITMTPDNYEDDCWRQDAGPTVFAPFPAETTYFGSAERAFMVNFRVRNLEALAAQLQAHLRHGAVAGADGTTPLVGENRLASTPDLVARWRTLAARKLVPAWLPYLR